MKKHIVLSFSLNLITSSLKEVDYIIKGLETGIAEEV